jgi:hypothetical protein
MLESGAGSVGASGSRESHTSVQVLVCGLEGCGGRVGTGLDLTRGNGALALALEQIPQNGLLLQRGVTQPMRQGVGGCWHPNFKLRVYGGCRWTASWRTARPATLLLLLYEVTAGCRSSLPNLHQLPHQDDSCGLCRVTTMSPIARCPPPTCPDASWSCSMSRRYRLDVLQECAERAPVVSVAREDVGMSEASEVSKVAVTELRSGTANSFASAWRPFNLDTCHSVACQQCYQRCLPRPPLPSSLDLSRTARPAGSLPGFFSIEHSGRPGLKTHTLVLDTSMSVTGFT